MMSSSSSSSSSDCASSDSDSDNIPLNVLRKIHHRNEKKAGHQLAGRQVVRTDQALESEESEVGSGDSDGSDSDFVSPADEGRVRGAGGVGERSRTPSPAPGPSGSPQTPGDLPDHAQPQAAEAEDWDRSMRSLNVDQRPSRGQRRTGGRGERRRSPTPPRQWTEHLTDIAGKRFTGSRPGPTGDFAALSEIETFQLLFTDEFFDEIVWLTNTNYEQKKGRSPAKHRMKWDPLSRDELRSWFGVIIGMGLLQLKGNLRKYWSQKHKLTRTDGFPEIFPRDRFFQILRYIHFVDEEVAKRHRRLAGFDKFYKVRFIFQYLAPKFREVYRPDRNLAVDESMIRLQARRPARQFARGKPARRGLKVFALAESDTGYVLNAELHEGKTDGERQNPHSVVTHLVEHYRGLGHVIFMDSCYSSVALFTSLDAAGFMAVGTLRENGSDSPRDLPRETVGERRPQVKRLRRGDALWRQSDRLFCVTWKDARVVYVLSTVPVKEETGPVSRLTKRDGQWARLELQRPNIISLYNKHMGGGDLADKKIPCYKRQTKSLKWYHKVIWYMLDIAILNASIVYNRAHRARAKLRDFRESLATSLIGGRSYRKAAGTPVLDNGRRFSRHLPHAPKRMETASTCKVHLQRVDTIFICAVCEVRMCPDPCFGRFHYLRRFAYDDPNRHHKERVRKKLKLTSK